ncbi:MAG: glycogen debranching enzyme GlgX, partial [Vicinamibacteria bacterium]
QVKLIAEPWDLGDGGYQVGNFPLGWAEWNDRYRDGTRGFWKGDAGLVGEMARRLTGSQDLYGWSGKRPCASVNFVTAHDGFTLHDLVSYNHKHNEQNGENNRDGHNHNLSWNHGVEGPTDDPAIQAVRERQKRNLLATLLLSQGVPMILAGDELGHTQLGNNNAYCLDNPVGWLDWTETPEGELLTDFVARLIHFRRLHPAFRRRAFFEGRRIDGDELKDVAWFKTNGAEMEAEDWHDPEARSFAMLLSGNGISERGPRGEALQDDDFLLLFSSEPDPVTFTLPPPRDKAWELLIDTASDPPMARQGGLPAPTPIPSATTYALPSRSFALLTCARSHP